MVFCSEHLSLAALVHAQPVTLRGRFRVFRVAWDDAVHDKEVAERLGRATALFNLKKYW